MDMALVADRVFNRKPLTYSLIHSLTHPPFQSLTHSLTLFSFNRLMTNSLMAKMNMRGTEGKRSFGRSKLFRCVIGNLISLLAPARSGWVLQSDLCPPVHPSVRRQRILRN